MASYRRNRDGSYTRVDRKEPEEAGKSFVRVGDSFVKKGGGGKGAASSTTSATPLYVKPSPSSSIQRQTVAALELARLQAATRAGDFATAGRAMTAYGRAVAPEGRSLTIVDANGRPQSRITVYERRVNARTQEEAARVGGSQPGEYVVRSGVLERFPEPPAPARGPGETWRAARDTRGWRFLTDSAMKAGNYLEVKGAGLANSASERWQESGRPTTGLGALRDRAQYDAGAAVRFAGQYFQGLSEGVREEPRRVALSIGVGVAFGAAGEYLGTAAQVGGTGAKLADLGFRGAAAAGFGYYAASEGSAIVNAERPGARAAQTSLDLAGFYAGSRIGAGLIPSPSVRSVQVTSTRGALTNDAGYPEGAVQRRGAVYVNFLGKTRRVGFSTSEEYFGGGVKGSVQYTGGRRVAYEGRLQTISEERAGPTQLWGRTIGRSLTIFEQGRESQFSTQAGASRVGSSQSQTLVGGRTVQPGVSGEYAGVLDQGRGVVRFNQAEAAPTRGLFTYGSGEVSTVFRPGEFSGFYAGSGQRAVTVPLLEPAGPAGPSVPLFGAYARGALARQPMSFFGFSSPGGQEVLGVTGVERQTVLFYSQPMSVSFSSPVSETSVQGFADGVSTGQTQSFVAKQVLTAPVVVAGSSFGSGGSSQFIPEPPIPFFPEAGMPVFGFGLGRKGSGVSGRTSFRTRYNPSIVAGAFNIRGSASQGRAAALTGVAVRPIV